MLSYVSIAATTAAAFTPAAMPMPSTAPARASVAPVMSEMTSRRAALLGLAAAAVPLAANADAVAVWKVDKKAIGANKGPPAGSGADKCNVAKPCTTGAGLKWDPKALGVAGGATKPDGSNPRKFFKTPTYANAPN